MVCSANIRNLKKPVLVFLILIIDGASIYAQDQHHFFHREFPEIWHRARTYTLEVVRAMPAEYLDFSPTVEQMSFMDQLIHVADNIYGLTNGVVLGTEGFKDSIDFGVHSKDDLIRILNSAFDYGEQVMKSISDDQLSEIVHFGGVDMSRERVFYIMRDHCTHHRAVAISYLRLKGIKPPRYRSW